MHPTLDRLLADLSPVMTAIVTGYAMIRAAVIARGGAQDRATIEQLTKERDDARRECDSAKEESVRLLRQIAESAAQHK